MLDPNPYASPRCDSEPEPVFPERPVGVWRCGEYLVLHHAAAPPSACVFTGAEPATGRIAVEFTGPGDRYLLKMMISLDSHSVKIWLPVTRAIEENHGWKTSLMYLSAVIGTALSIAFAATIRFHEAAALACFCGTCVAFLLAGVANVTRPWLALYDIDANYIWLRGASPDFLRRLPEWPLGPA